MSVVEDVRKVFPDFLAPELRSIGTRMDRLEKQRAEDKADILRAIADGNAHMEKRFELVTDYTKVLQRMDKLEESRQAESH